MLKMLSRVQTFFGGLRRDDKGATMIEYSILVGLITVVLVAIILSLSGSLETIWQAVQSALSDAAAG